MKIMQDLYHQENKYPNQASRLTRLETLLLSPPDPSSKPCTSKPSETLDRNSKPLQTVNPALKRQDPERSQTPKVQYPRDPRLKEFQTPKFQTPRDPHLKDPKLLKFKLLKILTLKIPNS